MPKRRNVRRVDTPEAQGDDSWVKVRSMELGEYMALQAERDGVDTPIPEAMRRGLKVVADHVVCWNWVDDDDQPLPQPGEHPEVLERLTDVEVRCLMEIFNRLGGPAEAELKN